MKEINLENSKKIESGFKIPDNYFEQFESKIMNQVTKEKDTKIVSLFYRKQIWISSIAALFLLAIAIPLYFNMAKESTLDSITIENYLEQQSVGTTELIKHLTEEDISYLENSLAIENVSDEAIENYLSESTNLDYLLNE